MTTDDTNNLRKNNEMNKVKKNNKVTVPNADTPVISLPVIDKISGVVDLTDVALCGLAYSGIINWLNNHELGVTKASGGRYGIGVCIHLPDADGVIHNSTPSVLVQVTHPKVTKRQARFEYNPSNMTEAGLEYLNAMFTELFGMGFYDVLHHARFTGIHVCRDILDQDISDYLYLAKWKQVSQCFFGKNDKLQTVNLGKKGANQITVYDKAAQLFGDNTDERIIRIEAKCKVKLTPKTLGDLPNPFRNVQVCSVMTKAPPFGLAHWRAFQDSCRLRGIAGAIKHQPADHRSKLKKALQPVSWWNIDDDQWPLLMQAAIKAAGLDMIPEYAPPLTMAQGIGKAA